MKIMIIDDTCHGHLICRYMCWILSQFGTYWYTLVHIGTYSRKLLQTDTRMYAGMPDTITDFFSHIIFLFLCFAYFPYICSWLALTETFRPETLELVSICQRSDKEFARGHIKMARQSFPSIFNNFTNPFCIAYMQLPTFCQRRCISLFFLLLCYGD